MKNLVLLTLGSVMIFLSSCSIESKPIQYGTDQCSFCKMTIVEKTHGAQVVTKKGRSHNFDAIECMVDYMKDKADSDFAFILVTDFTKPGTLVPANSASYLISKQLPSPMGAFLTGFEHKKNADEVLHKLGGEIVTWETLRNEK